MSKTPQAIRGTQDIFGPDAEAFAHVVETFERVRKLYRFRRVEMPVFEKTEVFSRSIGETTDVVSKEMYSFEDRGGDSLTLRPEFTAGIARAFLTNGWQQHAPLKVATHGPLFRYERPQKGRYRQFHQIDAEIIGAAEPQADVELLVMADQLLKELGISDGVTLMLNTLGDGASREAWRAALVEHFRAVKGELSEDSQERLEKNPLRILDSKDPRDKAFVGDAPKIDDFLSAEAQDFFGKVTGGLDAAGVEWTRAPSLVRGLDYYRHTAFEFVTDRLGAQGTVLGGGRYDGLMESLGGPVTPAVGWAAGIERLAMLVGDAGTVPAASFEVVVAVESDELVEHAMGRLAALRRAGISADIVATGSPRKRFDKAGKMGAKRVASLSLRDGGVVVNLRGEGLDEAHNAAIHALLVDAGQPFRMAVTDARLAQIAARFSELEARLASGTLEGKDFIAASRDYAELEPVAKAAEAVRSMRGELASLAELDDPEMRELAEEELERLKAELPQAEHQLAIAMLPRDSADSRPAMLEIRGGTGGDEAALFAADLFRMYERFAAEQGWRVEVVSVNANDIGGYKEVVANVTGNGVFAKLKFESGVHRVQRVPVTESGGRIHTSAATVAVLPEPDEVDVTIEDKDLKIDVYRASGAGGQHVNTTDSAVRITHLPTGVVVTCQDGRSQHKNKEKAMQVLRARLFEAQRDAAQGEEAEARKAMVGSGDRSERIRTYNFPQGRVTDHRINLTLHRLPEILEGPGLGELIDALIAEDQAARLAALGE